MAPRPVNDGLSVLCEPAHSRTPEEDISIWGINNPPPLSLLQQDSYSENSRPFPLLDQISYREHPTPLVLTFLFDQQPGDLFIRGPTTFHKLLDWERYVFGTTDLLVLPVLKAARPVK